MSEEWQLEVIEQNEKIFHVYIPPQPKKKNHITSIFTHWGNGTIIDSTLQEKKLFLPHVERRGMRILLVEPSLATTNKQVSKGMEKHPIIKITVVFWKGFDW